MEHAPLAYDFPWVLGKPGYHVNSTDSYERRVGPGGLFLSMDELLHFHRMLYSTTELLPHPDVAHMLSGYNDTENEYGIGMDFSTFKYANTGRHFGHGGDVDVPQLYGAGLANKDRYWMRTKLVLVPLLGFHVAVWTNYTDKLFGRITGNQDKGLTVWLSEWFENSLFGT